MPITVPMVSKKSESMREKIVTSAVIAPTRTNTSTLMPAPRLEKSGRARSAAGITACPGMGKARPPVTAFTTTASAVVRRMPIRRAPALPRACSQRVIRRPAMATATGAAVTSPMVTGTPGGPGLTMPAATSPMKRMKRPMPTLIACFSARGMAFMIASRNPVSTKAVMTRPSRKITPMAACQGSLRPAMSWKATTALSPMPEATARG